MNNGGREFEQHQLMSVVFLNSSILFATFCCLLLVLSPEQPASLGPESARSTRVRRPRLACCFLGFLLSLLLFLLLPTVGTMNSFSLFLSLSLSRGLRRNTKIIQTRLGAAVCLLLARFSHSNDDDDKSSFFHLLLLPTPFYTRRERASRIRCVSWSLPHCLLAACRGVMLLLLMIFFILSDRQPQGHWSQPETERPPLLSLFTSLDTMNVTEATASG